MEGSGTLTSLTQGAPFTPRGFTGHEHIDSAKLIHMNGRGYDYQLGRFLSVDPFIQAPANSQSHNPYSYIMNNPLAGTDPSGYLWCGTGSLGKADCDDEQKHKRRDSGSVGFRAAETIWINGGPAATNGARHSPRSAATGERGAIGGPGEDGTSVADGASSVEPSNISNKVKTRMEFWDNPEKLSSDGDDISINVNVYNAPDSGLTNVHVDNEITKFNSEFSGAVEGKGNLSITFVRVSSKKEADLFINRCGYSCRKEVAASGLNINKMSAFVRGVGRGNEVLINRMEYDTTRRTLTHEFGHYLGLHHQENKTNSIMSYSESRSVLAIDRRRLYDGYKKVL